MQQGHSQELQAPEPDAGRHPVNSPFHTTSISDLLVSFETAAATEPTKNFSMAVLLLLAAMMSAASASSATLATVAATTSEGALEVSTKKCGTKGMFLASSCALTLRAPQGKAHHPSWKSFCCGCARHWDALLSPCAVLKLCAGCP